MRRRHGGEPLACRSCGWQGEAGECEVVPVHRALGAYALPGAVWRGPMRELCPACGDEALEPARWCPECCGWTCLCEGEGQEGNEERPGP
ncbi:MAG: hypothetical protein NTV86_11185 [Planctomycetota bacterium]|nr:hypothetical protein [Planctomycetota bacterium]